ncbi:MAG TPA: bifunctional phosphoglucose/phosphomannose isomerase [Bacteroidia bacterium]|jgi:glucose/mannose-6-phosphate isomerase|nr:bifunctional phosphoglucose/phosphomannose isomerase [Bacteroidia bacterium]
MKKLVENFPNQLIEALQIAASSKISAGKNIQNVLITGLGGSGIGGTIVSELANKQSKIPVNVSKDYFIPSYVNENTLVIVSSYSGNTEETISAMQLAIERKAQIACITSGGKVKELAEKNNFDLIVIPGGNPPRSCLGYSLVQLLHILNVKQILVFDYKKQIEEAVSLMTSEKAEIQSEAKQYAEKLNKKIPVIYCLGATEGVAIRFRQQINENSKMLCWHHVIPEMNHNELVGWTEKHEDLAVCVLRTSFDYERNLKRLDINKTVISKFTSTIFEIMGQGSTPLVQALYLIHLTDWLSCYIADIKNIDPVEVKIIDFLKSELGK